METNAAPEGEAQTILIAEDEAMIRLIVAETLRDAGYRVREAADGQEALEILRLDSSIDLLVSDMKMPGLNGYQLVEAGTTLRPNLKVLLMTGYAQDPLPECVIQAGVRILYKPFDINELPFLAKAILKV